jgi:hypothetical protein
MDELKQQLIDYIEEHSDGFEDMPWWCLSMRYKRSTLISCTSTKPNNQKKGMRTKR